MQKTHQYPIRSRGTPVILLKSEAACGRCPLGILCMTLRPLPDVRFCRRCGAITFKRDGVRFLCTQIREGIYSRINTTTKEGMLPWQNWSAMSARDHKIQYTLAAVAAKKAEYDGCARLRGRQRHRSGALLPKRKKYRWDDCVQYFREQGNGFDLEL